MIKTETSCGLNKATVERQKPKTNSMSFSSRTSAKMSADKYNQSTDVFGLYGQVNKRIRWMPRQ